MLETDVAFGDAIGELKVVEGAQVPGRFDLLLFVLREEPHRSRIQFVGVENSAIGRRLRGLTFVRDDYSQAKCRKPEMPESINSKFHLRRSQPGLRNVRERWRRATT